MTSASAGGWAIITALFLIGAACGGLVFGWLGDRIGRVRAMALSVLVYSVFSGLCFFADRALAPGGAAVRVGAGNGW